MSSNICSSNISYSTNDKDISSKVNSLSVYYNLLAEKNQFLMNSTKELDEKFTKFKHKIYILSHKVCKHEETFNNIRPTCWIIEHTKEIGSNGGTAIKGNWETVKFNNIKIDNFLKLNDKNIILNNNTITIKPGSYNINVNVAMFRTGSSKIRLYNISDDAVVEESLVHYLAPDNDSSNTILELNALIHIFEETTFKIEYYAQHEVKNYGLGLGTGIPTKEIFSRVKIIKYYDL